MKPNELHRPKWNFRFVDIFLQKGAIHGLPYVGQRRFTLFERIFWLILAFVSIALSIHLALESLNRYRTKSTVISIERDYHYWNTSVPGATLCPMDRLSKDKFEAYCRDKNITGTDKDELFEFLESLANSSYFNFDQIKTFPSIDKHNIQPKDYIYLIYNLTDNVLHVPYNRLTVMVEHYNIPVHQILTEWGICYSTNNYLIDGLSTSRLLFGKAPPSTVVTDRPLMAVFKVNIFDGEGIVTFMGVDGYTSIFTHGPYEAMSIERRRNPNIESLECKVQVLEVTASDEFARSTTLEQRQCRFFFESNLTHYPVYSRNLCRQECRINLAYKLCKCIPHFYSNRDGLKPVCHYKTLKECIFKYAGVFDKLNLTTLSLTANDINCYCLPNCRNSEITQQTCSEMKEVGALTAGNGVAYDIQRHPRIRLQRQIIFTLTDLLVSVGGSAGFFLGSSVLSVVEIIYYFTVRLIWHCFGYRE